MLIDLLLLELELKIFEMDQEIQKIDFEENFQ